MIRTQFDREANALYIRFKRVKVETTERASHDVRVDFDRHGYVVGIEILNAREHVGPDVHKLPPATEELSLAEAEDRYGKSATTLRVQINNGRIKARKRGRDWVVEAAELENYLESVESGREASEEKPSTARRQRQRA